MVIGTSRERLSERDRWQEGRSTSSWGIAKREPFNTTEASQVTAPTVGVGVGEGVVFLSWRLPGAPFLLFLLSLIMLSAPEERGHLADQKGLVF